MEMYSFLAVLFISGINLTQSSHNHQQHQHRTRILTNYQKPIRNHQINHFVYCDKKNLDEIKPTNSYSGNKEIHIVHLPTTSSYDINDIKFHLSLAKAYKTPGIIDLELNKNFHSNSLFEVNLPGFKPYDVDSSLIPTPTTFSLHKFVKPTIKGIIPVGKFPEEKLEEIPHIEKYPLEHDYGKSSYDTPGALNSYGEPIHTSYSTSQNIYNNNNKNNEEENVNSENYINLLNEIHDIQRRRRQELFNSNRLELQQNKVNNNNKKYSNHRYT